MKGSSAERSLAALFVRARDEEGDSAEQAFLKAALSTMERLVRRKWPWVRSGDEADIASKAILAGWEKRGLRGCLDFWRYAQGVARKLSSEYLRERQRKVRSARRARDPRDPKDRVREAEAKDLLDCFEAKLHGVDLKIWKASRSDWKTSRSELCRELGISLRTLRRCKAALEQRFRDHYRRQE